MKFIILSLLALTAFATEFECLTTTTQCGRSTQVHIIQANSLKEARVLCEDYIDRANSFCEINQLEEKNWLCRGRRPRRSTSIFTVFADSELNAVAACKLRLSREDSEFYFVGVSAK